MKYINIIRRINKVLLIVCIILHVTIYCGLLFQIVLGFYQVLVAFVLLFYWRELKEKEQYKMFIYYVLVLLYLIMHMVGVLNLNGDYWYIFIAIIPMCIAFYFTYLLETLKLKE